VNLLGAHIDYSEGWVMPAAIDRAVWLAAAPASGGRCRVAALDLDDDGDFEVERLPSPRPDRGDGEGGWLDLPAGVAWALREAGHRPVAVDAVFASTVPMGKGVSSSAAVEVAFLLAWRALAPGLELDGVELARLGRRVENGYLGVGSGIMDQFASLHGARDRVILLDCRTLRHQLLPLPAGTAVLVADPGQSRQLAGSGFDDRRRQCAEAVAILRRWLPAVRTLRDVTPDDFELQSHRLPQPLRRRAQHAVEECRRVLDGADALRRGDLPAFGRLMRRSQLSSRDLYEVSTPELDLLAAAAWSAPGCHGARLAGGGFGGCMTILADADAAGEIRRAVSDAFADEFGRRPEVFTCRVDDGASVVRG
jgi:galactokinase